jgi:hypothetical protein
MLPPKFAWSRGRGSSHRSTASDVQRHIHNQLEEQREKSGRVRALILKGRQQGCSTYVGARFYHRPRIRGLRVFILTHEDAATQNLFEMVNAITSIARLVKPSTGAANAKELNFDRWTAATRSARLAPRASGAHRRSSSSTARRLASGRMLILTPRAFCRPSLTSQGPRSSLRARPTASATSSTRSGATPRQARTITSRSSSPGLAGGIPQACSPPDFALDDEEPNTPALRPR